MKRNHFYEDRKIQRKKLPQPYTDLFWPFQKLHAPLVFDIFYCFLLFLLFTFLLQKVFLSQKTENKLLSTFPRQKASRRSQRRLFLVKPFYISQLHAESSIMNQLINMYLQQGYILHFIHCWTHFMAFLIHLYIWKLTLE